MRDLLVVCLCAAWCRLCDDYAPVLQQVCSEFGGTGGLRLRTAWIDIEDEADLVDDFDVQTFPTLLAIDGTTLRFAGPLTPQADTLRRLLRSWIDAALGDEGSAGPASEPMAQALGRRLRERYPIV
jgi:thioredoxin 1